MTCFPFSYSFFPSFIPSLLLRLFSLSFLIQSYAISSLAHSLVCCARTATLVFHQPLKRLSCPGRGGEIAQRVVCGSRTFLCGRCYERVVGHVFLGFLFNHMQSSHYMHGFLPSTQSPSPMHIMSFRWTTEYQWMYSWRYLPCTAGRKCFHVLRLYMSGRASEGACQHWIVELCPNALWR